MYNLTHKLIFLIIIIPMVCIGGMRSGVTVNDQMQSEIYSSNNNNSIVVSTKKPVTDNLNGSVPECTGPCVIQIPFVNQSSETLDFSARIFNLPGSVDPETFTAEANEEVLLNIQIDGNNLDPGVASFGELRVNQVPPSVDFSMLSTIQIDDDMYPTNGNNALLNCATIPVSGVLPPFVISVELAADLPWVGDFTLKVFNPDGLELVLMNRPGVPASFLGNSESLSSEFPVLFYDLASNDAENMGQQALSFNEFICKTDGLCDYFPNPDQELFSVSGFTDLAASDPNGDWMICGGDSFVDVMGSIETATIIFSKPITATEFIQPISVVGFPDTPVISVTPSSMDLTLGADMESDINLNISNSLLAGLPLNWAVDNTATTNIVDDLYYQQVQNGTFTSFTSNVFIDGVNDPGGYSADSFTLDSTTNIDGFVFEGHLSNGGELPNGIEGFTVSIYADDNGVPAGHPEDIEGNELFTATVPINDASLELLSTDGPQDNIKFNVKNATGSTWSVPAGTYWVTVYAYLTGPDRWNWFTGVPGNDLLSQFIDPQDIFNVGNDFWTDMVSLINNNSTYSGMAFSILSLKDCGTSWLTYSDTQGSLLVGADQNITVTVNTADLLPGIYESHVCISSDDRENPLLVVPLTLTVNSFPDLIFATNFEIVLQ